MMKRRDDNIDPAVTTACKVIWGLICHRIPDATLDDKLDLAQDCWVNLSKTIKKYDPHNQSGATIETWMHPAIRWALHRSMQNYFRKRRLFGVAFGKKKLLHGNLPSPNRWPSAEQIERAAEEVKRHPHKYLTEHQTRIFILVLAGMNHRQIMAESGLTYSSVSDGIYEIRKRLASLDVAELIATDTASEVTPCQ